MIFINELHKEMTKVKKCKTHLRKTFPIKIYFITRTRNRDRNL